MFNRLQAKWKVSAGQLVLVIATFAFGGSLTGWAGKKLMELSGIATNWLYYFIYILLVTLLWPLAVLLVSIPFGQFTFFKKYIKRILGRFSGKSHKEVVSEEAATETTTMELRPDVGSKIDQESGQVNSERLIRVALFASGAGSNARQIIQYFRENKYIKISLIVSNKKEAGVLTIAHDENIPYLIIEKQVFFNGNAYVDELTAAGIDFIVLAGFLWKIPSALIAAYPNRIVNIHPALLPLYGGKGMYGAHVHEAVIAAGEKESGITIHFVDELYDHGNTIFQARCPVLPGDTAPDLAARIHTLEHRFFPAVIDKCIAEEFNISN